MERPNFFELGQKYPELEKCFKRNMRTNACKQNVQLDWNDENTQRTLTAVILKDEYNINIALPTDRLCPPVTNRLSYITWLAHLLDFSKEAESIQCNILQSNLTVGDTTDLPNVCSVLSSRHILDIGVGASCIYPLLGHRNYQWRFTGTDIDADSLEWASRNVNGNDNFAEFISLHLTEDCEILQKCLCDFFLRESLESTAAASNVHCLTPMSSLLISRCDNERRSVLNPNSLSLNGEQNMKDITTDNYTEVGNADSSNEEGQMKLPSTNWQLLGPVRSALLHSSSRNRKVVEHLEASFVQNSVSLLGTPLQQHNGHSTTGVTGVVEVPVFCSDSVDDERDFKGKRGSLYSACMTNPPFYDEEEEIKTSTRTVCTGSTGEMRTTGGEVAFVAAIIADSIILRESVLWYSAMLGKKSSLKCVLKILKSEGIKNVHTTRFDQGGGGRTMRWGVAWSFSTDGFSERMGAEKNRKRKHEEVDTADAQSNFHRGPARVYSATEIDEQSGSVNVADKNNGDRLNEESPVDRAPDFQVTILYSALIASMTGTELDEKKAPPIVDENIVNILEIHGSSDRCGSSSSNSSGRMDYHGVHTAGHSIFEDVLRLLRPRLNAAKKRYEEVLFKVIIPNGVAIGRGKDSNTHIERLDYFKISELDPSHSPHTSNRATFAISSGTMFENETLHEYQHLIIDIVLVGPEPEPEPESSADDPCYSVLLTIKKVSTSCSTFNPIDSQSPIKTESECGSRMHLFTEILQSEVYRNNRRWRRLLTAR